MQDVSLPTNVSMAKEEIEQEHVQRVREEIKKRKETKMKKEKKKKVSKKKVSKKKTGANKSKKSRVESEIKPWLGFDKSDGLVTDGVDQDNEKVVSERPTIGTQIKVTKKIFADLR